MLQNSLFHESITDALRDVVMALGGTKKVAVEMRPELPADHAARWLADCLNADRREKLNPDQIFWIMKRGRQVGCHILMNYLAHEAGYNVQPIEPQDEIAELQRNFIEAVAASKSIADRIERLTQSPLRVAK